ncbi:hypothetical protein LPJ61_005944 [Coemansia biformis]|uniref:Uncharacterized protein n=1 Tax=Coemansia biformis TaxID=1286918 RepID=A0A9W7Y1I7_9FUNG|nr:hypothetical protein LPJ61_005944 [Coemansia biformis]
MRLEVLASDQPIDVPHGRLFIQLKHFKNLMQGTMQSDISIPASKEHEPVTPLSTTITSLDLYLTGYRKLKEAVPLVKYVLLKIPTLTSFLVTQIGKRPILGFVDEYSQWYPHLANVKLKFSR